MSGAATIERTRVPRAARSANRPAWRSVAFVAAGLVLLPVVVVASSILTPSVDTWRHLWATRLPGALVETVLLLLGVGVGTLVLGAGFAWLTTAYRFPGRRLLSWLLVLPLAMPAYVLGFLALATLGHAGPIQSGLRGVFGSGIWFPDIRSVGGAATVMSLSLYPYVYLLARAAFHEQAAATYEAARALGQGPLAAVRRVVLPLARPSLAAGVTLVMMETLTDFATVQYFNVETISVSVYRVWQGMFDRTAATELAALVLLVAVGILLAERAFRGRARFHQQGGAGRRMPAVTLHGWRAWAATGACLALVGVAFAGPVAQLVAWSGAETIRGVRGVVDVRFFTYLGRSATIAAVVAAACVVIAVLVANGVRFSGGRATRLAAQLTTAGYAVPGVVVAIGVLAVLAGLDAASDALGLPFGRALLVTGSLAGLLYAYVVRFLALGFNSVDASLEKVTPSMTMSAMSLGASTVRVVRRVHLPLMRSGLGVALVLVAIDALKELPIVLLLRPFGWDTLAVWVWQLASESRWESAALPALTIVAAALVPVLLLFRRTARGGDDLDARDTVPEIGVVG
ncbi:MAG: ABC transporter permease [Nitriliruptorales bacterium]